MSVKRKLDLRSLPARIILSTILLVILTVTITGLPALWIIRQQLDHLAWTQIEQGFRAAQSLYAAKEGSMAGIANLIAQQPELGELVSQGNRTAVEDYLRKLQFTEGLDLVAICSSDQQIIASTLSYTSAGLCEPRLEGSRYLVSGEILPQVWLISTHPLETGEAVRGQAVVGLKLGLDFAHQMRSQTGLEHNILVDGQVVATSLSVLPDAPSDIKPRPSILSSSNTMICCTYEIEDQAYYGARLMVSEPDVQAEVVLPVDDIAATQRYLVMVVTGSMLAVAAAGSVAGVIIARRISNPLVALAGAANRFSRGDLDSPVKIKTELREVVQVSQALEMARLDLAKTLSALRQEKAWGEHLLESIVEGIVTLDDGCRITFFSHGAERITGWNRTEVLNHLCDDAFKIVEGGIPFSQSIPLPGQKTQITVKVAGDRQVVLSITRAQLTPTEALKSEIALVFRDASEEVIIHRLLGYFIANIAHEFRTPLSALAASIELLMDQAPDFTAAEFDELLKSLHLGVLSLQTLVDNLLESASIEAGHFRVSPRVYDLGIIIEEAAASMQPLLEKYEQRLILKASPDLPLVRADPRRIVQVLVNLISNASKYGPSENEITLSANVVDGEVRVEVADRGPGIAREHREMLFRRFEYPASAGVPIKVGAGLGLSVVKAIIEAHGGQTGMDDRPEGGSIFWFTLSAVDEK